MRTYHRFSLLTILAASLFWASSAFAVIEISRGDGAPVAIQDVYQRDGVAFVAINEVLAVLGLTGHWDNVAHLYRIETPRGVAVISPGSGYLRLDGRSVAVAQRPCFIDGKLRVSEPFLVEQFGPFLDLPLQVKNLNPVAPPPPESPLDQLFSLLLLQRPKAAADSEWVVAIDPGHGGQDSGALGKDGTTEQSVNLGVALQLQRLLKMRRGAPVVMTRDADYEVSAPRRLEAVASGQADVLLSLHTQSSFSPAAQGIMLFTTPEMLSPEPAASPQGSTPTAMPGVNASLHLAEALSEAFVAAGYQVAPIQQRTLRPLGLGNLPRVLIEMGYLTNEADLIRLRDPAHQAQLARALFDGLETFLKNYQNLQESQDEPGQSPARQ